MCESEIMQKEVGVRQRGNRGGSDCVSCLREVSARAEQGISRCKSWVGACQGKEVTKCYMRVTAPFPTQRATLSVQNEDIVPLLSPSKCKKGGDICHPDFAQRRKTNGRKNLVKNCLLPPAAFFEGTEMRLRPP